MGVLHWNILGGRAGNPTDENLSGLMKRMHPNPNLRCHTRWQAKLLPDLNLVSSCCFWFYIHLGYVPTHWSKYTAVQQKGRLKVLIYNVWSCLSNSTSLRRFREKAMSNEDQALVAIAKFLKSILVSILREVGWLKPPLGSPSYLQWVWKVEVWQCRKEISIPLRRFERFL